MQWLFNYVRCYISGYIWIYNNTVLSHFTYHCIRYLFSSNQQLRMKLISTNNSSKNVLLSFICHTQSISKQESFNHGILDELLYDDDISTLSFLVLFVCVCVWTGVHTQIVSHILIDMCTFYVGSELVVIRLVFVSTQFQQLFVLTSVKCMHWPSDEQFLLHYEYYIKLITLQRGVPVWCLHYVKDPELATSTFLSYGR